LYQLYQSYREIKKSDYPEIKAILGEAFAFNREISSPLVLRLVLSHYLALFLKRYRYSRAVFPDGEKATKLAGVILGNWPGGGRPYFRAVFSSIAGAVLAGILFFFSEGRRHLRVYRSISRCNRRLMREAVKKSGKRRDSLFDAELLLLLVRKDLRGRGIGKALVEQFFNYLRSIGKGRVFLFTDDYCDTGFYRQDYRLEAETVLSLPGEPGFHGRLYLFSREIANSHFSG
jgi:ribosomal protein S18 acetylase RimI-like enzyme